MSNVETKVLNILLVEDDDAHAQIVRLALEGAEMPNHVERVTDGEAAIAYLRGEGPYGERERPGLVLLDLRLPKLDGHEVLERVKSDRRLRHIPIVILSTSDAERDVCRAYDNHVNSYMVKPADFIVFRDMIRNLSMYWGRWNHTPSGVDS